MLSIKFSVLQVNEQKEKEEKKEEEEEEEIKSMSLENHVNISTEVAKEEKPHKTVSIAHDNLFKSKKPAINFSYDDEILSTPSAYSHIKLNK